MKEKRKVPVRDTKKLLWAMDRKFPVIVILQGGLNALLFYLPVILVARILDLLVYRENSADPLRKSRLLQSCPDLILIRLFQRFQRNILRYGIWKNQCILKQYSNLIPDKICLSSGNLRPLYCNFPGRNRIQTA